MKSDQKGLCIAPNKQLEVKKHVLAISQNMSDVLLVIRA